MIYTAVCPICTADSEVTVVEQDYIDWEDNGILIQDAMPYLNADERELLMTGICVSCWENMDE